MNSGVTKFSNNTLLPYFHDVTFSDNRLLSSVEPGSLKCSQANSPLVEFHLTGSPLVTELPASLLTGCKALEIVDFARCSLVEIPECLKTILKVKQVILSNNNITEIGGEILKEMHSLEMIDLSSNQIASLVKDTFYASIVDIRLSGNKITAVEPGTFADLAKLARVDLSENPLGDGIDESAFVELWASEAFSKLSVQREGMLCDCALGWMLNGSREGKIAGFRCYGECKSITYEVRDVDGLRVALRYSCEVDEGICNHLTDAGQ